MTEAEATMQPPPEKQTLTHLTPTYSDADDALPDGDHMEEWRRQEDLKTWHWIYAFALVVIILALCIKGLFVR